MTDLNVQPTTLRPLEKRPSAYTGGDVPYDLARWLRTHPVDKVEFAPEGDDVRLWSGRGHATTPFAHRLGFGPSTTIDGARTLVTLSRWVVDLVDPMIEWERRNPEERPFGAERLDLKTLKVCAANLLGLPQSPERVGMLDRLLSLHGDGWQIERMREALRADPHDAHGTVVATVGQITDLD